MSNGEVYIIKSDGCIGIVTVVFSGSFCIKLKWMNGITEWIYRDDLRAPNKFVDPKIMIIEKINKIVLLQDTAS
jgi:hypothetical protein